MDDREMQRLAAQRAEWAGILILEIMVVCSVRGEVASEVVARLRDAIEAGWDCEVGARAILCAVGVQNVTIANYCDAARQEIDAMSA